LLIAYDGTDKDAPARRLAARPRHLESIEKLKTEGRALYGAALIDGSGGMIGSVVIYDFESREAFDDYLRGEPYITENVWQRVEVSPCRVPPVFLGE
ncbi:hypothetical protein EG829_16320, partial [bacterium]|nr:hypothetical protein [bacterium]